MPEQFDSVPELMALSVVFCRVLLAVLCAETGWRYARWWRIVQGEEDTFIMRDLMLGIAVVQAGFLLFAVYALLVARVPHGTLALTVYFIGDGLITLGTLLHLRPAWRMSRRWKKRVGINVGVRTVTALVLAVILLVLDLQ